MKQNVRIQTIMPLVEGEKRCHWERVDRRAPRFRLWALVRGGGFCYNNRMKTTLALTATLVATVTSFAEVVSEKSPDGRNEIRLTTEPVLSYSVLRDGKERVAPTPISMTVEGKSVLGGHVQVTGTARSARAATFPTPIYK